MNTVSKSLAAVIVLCGLFGSASSVAMASEIHRYDVVYYQGGKAQIYKSINVEVDSNTGNVIRGWDQVQAALGELSKRGQLAGTQGPYPGNGPVSEAPGPGPSGGSQRPARQVEPRLVQEIQRVQGDLRQLYFQFTQAMQAGDSQQAQQLYETYSQAYAYHDQLVREAYRQQGR